MNFNISDIKISPQVLFNIAKRVAIVSAIFTVVLSTLMITNYIQTKSIDPLNSPALNQLMLQLQNDPQNKALKEQIRALDLLARKAYFTNQWQIRAGGFLLFTAVLLLLLSLKYINSLRLKLPDLTTVPVTDESWDTKILSRKYLIYSILFLFVFASLTGVLSESELDDSSIFESKAAAFPSMDELRDNWPGFRGPHGNGIVYQSGFPTEWDGNTGKNIIWKVADPKPSFNSPIIWEGKIFLAGADQDSQLVYSIDSKSGAIVWQTTLNDIPGTPAEKPRVSKDTGYAAPTMATDGRYVYVIFATGDVACLDFEGNRVWVKNIGIPDNHYGHASSLITYKDLLLIQYDHNSEKQLLALRTTTGDMVYSTPRDVQISWASPILANMGGREEIILSSNPFVISYDPQNGKELWRVKCMEGEVAPSPVYADQMVFAVNEYARLAAINITEQANIVWEYDDDLSEVASPIASEKLIIMASSYGTVTCLDAKSGEKQWVHEFDEGFYSSPIMVGDLIYLMDMKGLMHLFKADKEFQLIQDCPLGEEAMSIPAFYNGRIYIRGVEHLFCIGNKDG